MGISDILTIITILIALAAFLSESNRKYIILKFSRLNWIILILLAISIHFLLGFNWFLERMPFLSIFVFNDAITSNVWAYFITLTFLSMIVVKFFFGFYPSKKREIVIKEYINLILKGDFSTLIYLIDKYHFKDIIKYIQIIKKLNSDEIEQKKKPQIVKELKENESGLYVYHIDTSSIFQEIEEYKKKYRKVIKTNRLEYADSIYHNIVLHDSFVEYISANNPYFYTPIIKELNTKELSQRDFINRYLQVMTKYKNHSFFNEVYSNSTLISSDDYDISENSKILSALFNDIAVIEINQAWRGIAEEALLEMDEEIRKKFSILRKNENDQYKDKVRNYRITIAIQYFDIMLRKAILSGSTCFMWNYYYKHFVDSILKNLNTLPDNNSEINRNTRNFNLIELIMKNLVDWILLILETGKLNLLDSICRTIGSSMYSIAIEKNLNINDKNELINYMFGPMINIDQYKKYNDEIVDKIFSGGLHSFLIPKNFECSKDPIEFLNYRLTIIDIYKNYDKYMLFESNIKRRYNSFKSEVIDKL